TAEIVVVIGTARDPGGCRFTPVTVEIRIKMIAAFGRFHIDEADARTTDPAPVDITLPAGDIDTMHLISIRMRPAPVMRRRITDLRKGPRPRSAAIPARSTAACDCNDQYQAEKKLVH